MNKAYAGQRHMNTTTELSEEWFAIVATTELYDCCAKKKSFFKKRATFNNALNKYVVEIRLFVQVTYPTAVYVTFTDKELENYHKKYTFRTSVVPNDLAFTS